ncbi:MAG: hypothetical protein ABI277_02320 [Burkholderiaceae bacterium]
MRERMLGENKLSAGTAKRYAGWRTDDDNRRAYDYGFATVRADAVSEIIAHHEGARLHSPDRTIAMARRHFPNTMTAVATACGRSCRRTGYFSRKVDKTRVPA